MVLYTTKHRIPFQIDEADYEVVSRHTWHVHTDGYVRTGRNIRLHTLLLGKAPHGLEWDHENRDKLDNRRDNLRAVTHAVNGRNRGANWTSLSGVKGVYPTATGRYYAQLRRGGWCIHLGSFDTLEEAAAARAVAEERTP